MIVDMFVLVGDMRLIKLIIETVTILRELQASLY